MSVVLDTSVLVDVLRVRGAALAYVGSLPEAPYCSEVSRFEVQRGVRSGERRATEALFLRIEWVVVNEAVARVAAELGRRYRRSHPGVDAADLVVAATAQLLGADLATSNVRHFPMFEGLRPPYES